MKIRILYETNTLCLNSLTKLTRVHELRLCIKNKWPDLDPEVQRLLHRGKELGDGILQDYRFGTDDVIQCIKRSLPLSSVSHLPVDRINVESKYFVVGDHVDILEPSGAWFESKLIATHALSKEDICSSSDGVAYLVQYERFKELKPCYVGLESIRLRSYHRVSLSNLKSGMTILANYNYDHPDKRGFWFECLISSVSSSGLFASLVHFPESLSKKIRLRFVDEMYCIQEHIPSQNRDQWTKSVMRTPPPNCDFCQDSKDDCTMCSCCVCHLKDRPEVALLCDDCHDFYHIYCLQPPLTTIPDEDWYCPKCKRSDENVVKIGSQTSQKRKLDSHSFKRDKGKEYSLTAHSKECRKVPKDHFGPIPGIDVGMCWRFRSQIYEEGVHRHKTSSFYGSTSMGGIASVVLSVQDVDNGDTFWLMGSGVAQPVKTGSLDDQKISQVLERTNLAVAMNCAAPICKINGSDAGSNWRKGKPVRVLRSFGCRKFSKYAPNEGLRYDGIYKVVKYKLIDGPLGYPIWKFFFQRDDPSHAPWTKEGMIDMLKKGYSSCIHPTDQMNHSDYQNKNVIVKRRKLLDDNSKLVNLVIPKLISPVDYIIDPHLKKLISNDTENKKMWRDILNTKYRWKLDFYNQVEEELSCICCKDIVLDPVTTPCQHNMCKKCILRVFKEELYSCPSCRKELGRNYSIKVNKSLQTILRSMFDGYESGRC
ncbi:E3 ubiquitin-protein ligase UHRF1 [Lepeophtheirus salmonis]|uniref:RING-type E3 ubiquitin transferase n=1 Tax=Lepeophtheirus salmonis TaxID=72036 RepID=A0A0K2UG26_LEPSM|nr:E3 ubiquitin-protein ligase UHRF1-like [Lepeophtheirus salmonis]